MLLIVMVPATLPESSENMNWGIPVEPVRSSLLLARRVPLAHRPQAGDSLDINGLGVTLTEVFYEHKSRTWVCYADAFDTDYRVLLDAGWGILDSPGQEAFGTPTVKWPKASRKHA